MHPDGGQDAINRVPTMPWNGQNAMHPDGEAGRDQSRPYNALERVKHHAS